MTTSTPIREADSLPPVPDPAIDRPRFPDGYGVDTDPAGARDWASAEQKLVAAQHYWLCSVRPDGTPHTVPRWGVWVAGRFFYDGAPTTRHTRNVEVNPACTLTLESGTDVVIVEGNSVAVRARADGLGERIAAAFGKYAELGYSPEANAWESMTNGGGLRAITPRRAFAWSSFPTDCTRFTFATE
ncbi:pyridoxamine 5'-phosphate oxidase-related FMN- binding protein [Gordonia bronchialis DSM 43247]|uniref:Pyridoxamine 5'-phosphate oxidase-related FMN-binding protein n=1 Tax=Gordonia bronchialis (strain ATCC 25592 / DSM 43247 / BCRC 13721 / JCM 3198 / KCTC 3076 / NBRC 16047 / NCTC 10667) TaxID=526226 RepID=D0L2X6_GORB4|nr:pyridoxamine 5'-phosphate oxidase family protein [Gordonia bronchialis]ACY20101.1 pyridoxamine 5'-phosphate oxidase-related FMN- binding protein [Gordonia bronchialis DSM 43247]MCC3322873.1 pyridoxamine 5'-phosphate oxidase family protein [Gordonia bronchialis]QGS26055.1 pyridoxamine 5'-phosphate oxidase [Gordonia bronchialis]UAK37551.1 pyridoxamine 5'-phosphate oxidase family protein [Gordonia bronchialis]STQ62891.1 PPOX class probable F420-dependent enzyme, Rv3369 family [Gordonia bronchi